MTARERIVVLSSPRAGGADEDTVERARAVLARSGDVEVFQPSSKEAFDDEVRAAAAGARVVVVAGGDGTVSMTVNALADRLTDLTFGIVPMGTGNDLARTLRLPDEPEAAARILLDGTVRRVDVWRAVAPSVSRLFVNACVGGFPVAVDEAVGRKTKRLLGRAAYTVGALKAATRVERHTVQLAGRQVEDCVTAGVGNGRTAGGGTPLWPEANPGDGQLDACALGASGFPGAVRLALSVRRGRHTRLPGTLMARDRSFTIEADPAMEFNLDGELLGLRTPVTFERAGSMAIRAPNPGAAGEDRERMR